MRFGSVVKTLLLPVFAISTLAATATVKRFPDPMALDSLSAFDVSAAPPVPASLPMTNGQRFARGMGPAPPRRFHDPQVIKRQATSPTYRTGTMSAYARNDGSFLGYVQNTLVSGRYFTLTQDAASALPIRFQKNGGLMNVDQLNSANLYPEFGAVVATASDSNDINTGSSNFVILAATTQTSPGSPPQSGSNTYLSSKYEESAIWTYDIATAQFTPHWVNTDGSAPVTNIVLQASNNYLFMTGDVTAMQGDYGASTQLDLFLTT